MKYYFLTAIVFAVALLLLVSYERPAAVDPAGLGKMLFFDPILSANKQVSCASCHRPEFAFSDTAALSRGVFRRRGTRNAPSVMNVRLNKSFFWDGRAATLEEQALGPIENPLEMNLPLPEALSRLKADPIYARLFKEVFDEEPSIQNMTLSLAAFQRTLETFESPFDDWRFTGKADLVSEEAKRGFILFNGKGKCVRCHFGGDFTTHEFRNIGLFDGRRFNDSGRYLISGDRADIGKFKTPGLRNVAITAPYMHNGALKTLNDVVDFYNEPTKKVPRGVYRDTILAAPLKLTRNEKKELVAFLQTLTDKQFQPGHH